MSAPSVNPLLSSRIVQSDSEAWTEEHSKVRKATDLVGNLISAQTISRYHVVDV